MTTLKVISETPISVHDLRKEIEKIKKRDGELNYRANKTEEYLNNVIPTEHTKKSDKVYDELVKLNIPRLKDTQLKKIIDLSPKSIKEVKAVLQGYSITLTNEHMQKVVELFK